MTNWSRERWRKLYVREPLEQQAWGWAARGLRDLLIRVAEDDGRVARSRDRLRLALHVASEDEMFDSCLEDLLDDGFLVEDESGVYVRNLPVAQGDERQLEAEPEPENETPEERRRRLARERKRRSRSRPERDQVRDTKRDLSVTERDTGDPSPPPLASPSPLPSQKNQTEETETGGAARASERDRSVTTERDASRVTERDSVTAPASQPSSEEQWHGRERETPCPLDLLARAKSVGVLRTMAQQLRVDELSLEAKAEEFVGYWTIGGGMGKARSFWMRRLREELRRAAKDGKLPAPGAVLHRVHEREERERAEATSKVSRLILEGARKQQGGAA